MAETGVLAVSDGCAEHEVTGLAISSREGAVAAFRWVARGDCYWDINEPAV
jgi:hypothetical protein